MRIFLAVAVLVVVNALNNRLAPELYVPVCLAAAAVLILIARWDGITWGGLGLGEATLGRGLRWGLILAGAVLFSYLMALAVPITRPLFLDERADDLSVGQLLFRVLIRVPFGTVLLEEVAFRGVLWAMVERRWGVTWATSVSSILFGFWHVLPSLGITRANSAVGAVFGHSTLGVALSVAAAIVGTAAAGVVFCELRRRSGSLLTSAALHWALNGEGYILAWGADRWWGAS
ncbi:CPBP family intramembrane glutamic endopeptidase [Streptomyces sp. V1I1]|uniref:CPBP family intramembrane glutamic endopeptidase n=1 Tax=Streptomyces sp. V1I1 TaxID=3042272 RepID=UPI0027831BA6|nr:CPBP family intramembrane glutamic endopeptidase [Streptomyces sp. V1I1]MDQ0945741.1 membrane protease YdiL (CAAX protease family) [Streptomyces sp. V1I1]